MKKETMWAVVDKHESLFLHRVTKRRKDIIRELERGSGWPWERLRELGYRAVKVTVSWRYGDEEVDEQ